MFDKFSYWILYRDSAKFTSQRTKKEKKTLQASVCINNCESSIAVEWWFSFLFLNSNGRTQKYIKVNTFFFATQKKRTKIIIYKRLYLCASPIESVRVQISIQKLITTTNLSTFADINDSINNLNRKTLNKLRLAFQFLLLRSSFLCLWIAWVQFRGPKNNSNTHTYIQKTVKKKKSKNYLDSS